MRRRHRHIHGRYGSYPSEASIRHNVMGVIIVAIVLFIFGKMVLGYFGVGNTVQRYGVTLTMANLGNVQVSIEGGDFKRAEDDQKLYSGDRVTTSVGAHALLTFFDTTAVRLNELSGITIEESLSGEKESEITIYLNEGSIWLSTPEKDTFSGAITRTVRVPQMKALIPSNTEGVITQQSIVVFSADGIGITLKPKESLVPIVVGEGQKFVLPSSYTKNVDLYAYRSPLDPFAMQSDFVVASRTVYSGKQQITTTEPEDGTSTDVLEGDTEILVLTPKNEAVIKSSTVKVSGKIGKGVARVRINGYIAIVDKSTNTFSLELTLPDTDEAEIIIGGLDENGTVLSEVRRKVTRDRKPPPPPTITSPAKNGQTYRTQMERFVIDGTTSSDTVSVIVNDYRLQLYKPGNTTWTYLASTNIDNLYPGKNVYKVVTINSAGIASEPAEVTILLEEGEVGVIEEEVDDETVPEDEEEEPAPISPRDLPDNRPLKPGSLKVIAPTAGTNHIASGSSFLIEGTTISETESLWVNDYSLRLYEPGKTTWNYIADTDLGTLHRGVNLYLIITRNSRGRILDRLEYKAEFNPGRN